MIERETKEKNLKDAVTSCIILSEEDRNFWLGHASILPDKLLEIVTGIIESKNKLVDEYIGTAIADDPDHKYLADLKGKIQKIKETAFSMEEETEKGSAEASLKEQLKKLEEE